MKVWRFFRVPENLKDYEGSGIRVKDKLPLYAITNKKKYANIFKKSRKDGSFICKCDNTDKDDATEYMNNNRGKVLGYNKLMTYRNGDIRYPMRASVVMTTDDYNTLDEIIESCGLLSDIGYITPDIFSKDTQKILISTDYVNHYLLFTGEPCKTIDYDFPQMDDTYDELMVFIWLYDVVLDTQNFPETIKYS